MHSVNLTLDSSVGSVQIDNTGGQVRRLSVRETTGSAAAEFNIWDGTGNNGQLLDVINLSAGQSTRDYYRCHEYPFHNGLFIEVVSGDFLGAVVVQHKHDGEEWGEPVIVVGSITNVFSQ